ncbi:MULTISPECIES: GumC family protein [Methylococcus]|uniref:Chain length determinant protein n=1 Tax=Methylococcus capsulatus TaxID=414 RepID=A0ABZ2F2R2_METCP|nr:MULTISPECIES: chain length determinant protein [Methylococcus]MDF9391635.1 chain length determinant protein [Methylococcus capsulatus]
MNASASEIPQNSPQSAGTLMPLVSFQRHRRIALIVMAVVVVLGAGFAWVKGKAVYSATAVLYVAPRFVNILKDSKELDIPAYDQFIEHQARTVPRYDILLESLAKLGDKRYVWQREKESDRRAAERLQAALEVKPVKDSYLITVTLESTTPDHLDELVNTIVDTYLEKSRESDSFFARNVRLASLRERRGQIQDEINTKLARRTEIAQELSVTTFSEQLASPYDKLLIESQNALAAAQRNRLASEAALALFEDRNSGQDAIAAAAFDAIQKDPGLISLKGSLYKRRSELLQQASGLDPRHPLKIQIDREFKEIDEELNRTVDKLNEQVAKSFIDQRRSDVKRDRQIEQELSRQLESFRQKASWFARLYNEALSLNDEIERSRKQLDMIDERIEFFELESRAPGFVRVETYARPPELPVKGGRKKLFAVVLVVALMLGGATPIGLDMLDQRIRTTGQVAKIIGHRPVAWFVEHHGSPDLKRMSTDQLRRLAIAVNREREVHGNRLVLLTSVKPDAGVTSLALDLASELAVLGVRTVVVEADAIKPDPRYRAEPAQPGLADLLAGSGEVPTAVVAAADGLPDRLGMGTAPGRQLFAYPTLRRCFDELKAAYDLVLVDAPPLLLSADTEYLVEVADVTLLLVGAGQVKPGELRRAAGILQKIDPSAVGFVVTRLEVYRGGGYYAKLAEEFALAIGNENRKKHASRRLEE